MRKLAVISLSGGMDSTCLLIWLLARGYQVFALSFNYGQKHDVELERLQKNLQYLKEKGYEIPWTLIDISFLPNIYKSSLLNGQEDVPQGHYEEENMKSTVVPNRNGIFSSFVYGYGLSLAKEYNSPVDICLGVHSGDHAIYPDCRPEFYKDLEQVFKSGNWDSENVNFELPFLHENKTSILKECLRDCEFLSLDFDTVLANTNTSYNPTPEGLSSGTSGADIERIEAFYNINRKDPVPYVGGWDFALENALKILNK